MSSIGRIGKQESSKETIDGNRDIFISDGMAFMEQTAPRYESLGNPVTADAVMESLGLTLADVADGLAPGVVNTGNSFMLVPLRDEKTLAQIEPNQAAISDISDQLDLIGYYAFTTETKQETSDAATRMFAPRYGIPEEAATGMAAGPLACFLYDKMDIKKPELVIEQGYLMNPPSPSLLTVRLNLDGGVIRSLMAGGRAIVSKTLNIELD
jgi:PhzF family phenazine biosynthesis protein